MGWITQFLYRQKNIYSTYVLIRSPKWDEIWKVVYTSQFLATFFFKSLWKYFCMILLLYTSYIRLVQSTDTSIFVIEEIMNHETTPRFNYRSPCIIFYFVPEEFPTFRFRNMLNLSNYNYMENIPNCGWLCSKHSYPGGVVCLPKWHVAKKIRKYSICRNRKVVY